MKRFAIRRCTLSLATALVGICIAPAAHATCTAVLINPVCSATVSATNLVFGNYNANTTGSLNVSSTVTVNFTASGVLGLLVTVGYQVSLSAGSNSTITQRQLVGPSGNFLLYNLYVDSAGNTVWGDKTVSESYSVTLALLATATVTKPYTVYGRIPAAQYVAPGAYSNTITVTVDF